MPKGLARLIEQHREHERAVDAWHALQRNLPSGTVDASVGGLTICSVAFRAATCLDLNDLLMRRLNPDTARPHWLLYDNNMELSERIRRDDPRFTVVDGAGGRDFTLGYDHALGIGTLLSRVRTRFLLILDPDCFIVMPDWIARATAYMAERGLGFFGTPINPRRHNSYRYFPYMVCMFVDLMRVPLRDLCFVPDVFRLRANLSYRARRLMTRVPKAGFLFRWLLTEQYKTNGWRIKRQYGRGDQVKFECVQPVWDVNDAIPPGSIKRAIHNLTPAPVSPVPKWPGYVSPHGFRDFGAPDVARLGWEEFVWRDRPFAFHVGSVHAQHGRYERQLDAVVCQFTQQIAAD